MGCGAWFKRRKKRRILFRLHLVCLRHICFKSVGTDQRRKVRGVSGSATIEMSILTPMLCVLIIVLLYLGIYLYNRTVLYGSAYLAAYAGVSEANVENEEAYRMADNQMREQMEGRLIAMDVLDPEITVTYDEVTVSYEGNMILPIATKNIFFERWNLFEIGGEVSAQRHRPVQFIRQCRKLEALLTNEEKGESDGNGRTPDAD